ncbi:ABC transporter permease [Galactobacter caseinivorans]|uniref:ABC transporter permease n=1 Tax=Galactobacter caseinivorans TaxID=2676123 RepID=A0A496PHH4_9MICC|nr:ABC transporter permease [Galactobacter caseinivorans]RKW69925.1 ABC transporter permease [Galactobacter caseinivorans]
MRTPLLLVARTLVTLCAASVLIFVLLRLVPGDPAQVALGVDATPELVQATRERFGLDRPLVVQYLEWMGGLLTGHFGTSFVSGQEMSAVVLDRTAVTLWLALPSIALALLIATVLGTWAALRRRSVDGLVITVGSQMLMAVPGFLAGVLLVLGLSLGLGWLPPSGWVVPADDPAAFLAHLVLPVLALTAVQAAILTRYVREAMLEVIGQDYIVEARSKGLTRGQALVRHGLRNAAVPVLTVTGVQLSALLVGAVVIESVFDVPGVGSLLVEAVAGRDMVSVQGIVMVLVLITVVLNLCVDLLHTVIDPRTRA